MLNPPGCALMLGRLTSFYVIFYFLEWAFNDLKQTRVAKNEECLNQVEWLYTGDKDGRGGPKRVSVDKDPTYFTVTQALQGVQRMLQYGLITSPRNSGP